jgi:hypothetical protein
MFSLKVLLWSRIQIRTGIGSVFNDVKPDPHSTALVWTWTWTENCVQTWISCFKKLWFFTVLINKAYFLLNKYLVLYKLTYFFLWTEFVSFFFPLNSRPIRVHGAYWIAYTLYRLLSCSAISYFQSPKFMFKF